MVSLSQRAGFSVLWLVITINAAAGVLPTIVNDEYKFSAGIPITMISCEAASGNHPHGFTILLHPEKQGCSSSTPQPYVGLFGDYNVLYAKTPVQSLRFLCSPSQVLESGELHSLAFPGHASAACRKNEENGWVDVFVVAQAGSWPDETGKSDAPYINYTAQLHTRAAVLTRDLKIFKRILAAVNISGK
jgi:hypothetical protein